MRQPIETTESLLAAANAVVPKIVPETAMAMIEYGDVLVVDVRDAEEVEKSGKIAGAVNVSRGMLEFRADPQSPCHDDRFRRNRTVILYCASGDRSALAGRTLAAMGYERVLNLGAFRHWMERGGATESP